MEWPAHPPLEGGGGVSVVLPNCFGYLLFASIS